MGNRCSRDIAGFSLLELTLSIVLLSTLMLLTLPSYQHIITQHRRRVAITTLATLILNPQQTAPLPKIRGYTLNLEQLTPTSYLINATPTASQAQHTYPCGRLTLYTNGKRLPKKPACWR